MRSVFWNRNRHSNRRRFNFTLDVLRCLSGWVNMEMLRNGTDKHFNRLKASIAPLIGHHPSAKTFVILTTA